MNDDLLKIVGEISAKADDTNYKVNRLMQAMTGDAQTGTTGYGARLLKVEQEIEVLKQEQITRKVYMKQLTWVFTGVGGSLIGYVLSLIYKLWN